MPPEPHDPSDSPGRNRAPEVRTAAQLRGLLEGKSEEEALRALTAGDPLRMSRRVKKWLQSNWVLMDRRQLMTRALPHLVQDARGIEDEDALEGWLTDRITVAAWGLFMEEERAARLGEMLEEPLDPRYRWLQAVGIDEPAKLRRACVAFNGLPDEYRHAAYAMLVEKEGFAHFARRMGISARESRDRMVRALAMIREVAEREIHD